MKTASKYIDTDVLIRLLTGDDLKKQQAATKLFEKVEQGKLIIFAPDTVIADTVYVLSSSRLYNLPRIQIRDMLAALLKLSSFKIDNKQALFSALEFYTLYNIDFGDVLLAALTLQSKSKSIYAYDHDFDKISGIKRLEP